MGLTSYFFTLGGRQKLFKFLVTRVRWICAVLLLGGIAWLLALPNDDFNIPTRISENALLPGQVQTHFGGSDYKVLNAFRNEIRIWQAFPDDEPRLAGIESIFQNAGLKSARQAYNVSIGPRRYSGTNVYGLLEAPRGDATEALVLNAAWKNRDGVINEGGVTQLLALARYFRRWSLWSKDIIFVIPFDREYGSQAWLDAYHENQDLRHVEPLPLRAGAIQAGVDIDWYGDSNRYNDINIRYEGTNGQLCNLDLVNSAIHIAKHQLGVQTYIQNVHGDDYYARLLMMFRALVNQAHGLPTGSHSPYIPYKIDTISIEVHGQHDGQHDDSSLGRVIESVFRSLNNILEHLHASFFFYILISTYRFVSIGTYLPSAMLLAICFTITGISIYLKTSGIRIEPMEKETVPLVRTKTIVPVAIVATAHALGLSLFYVLRYAVHFQSSAATLIFLLCEYAISFVGPSLLAKRLTHHDLQLINSFSQIVLGMFLSAIATINFPLALVIGLICFPISLTTPIQSKLVSIMVRVLLLFTSPSSVLFMYCTMSGREWHGVLLDLTFAYEKSHVWTPLTVFGVWWPVYFLANVVVS